LCINFSHELAAHFKSVVVFVDFLVVETVRNNLSCAKQG